MNLGGTDILNPNNNFSSTQDQNTNSSRQADEKNSRNANAQR